MVPSKASITILACKPKKQAGNFDETAKIAQTFQCGTVDALEIQPR